MRLSVRALAVLLPLLASGAARADGVPAEVLARVAPAVVRVLATQCGGESRSGSGFAWTAPGRIVTALHVVAGCGRIEVSYQGLKVAAATVERSLASADLALLAAADAPAVTPLAAADQLPRIGSTVDVYGYPLDQPTRSDAPLYVTDANRETPLLRDAVGDGERQQIRTLGFPSLDVEILRVDGNLLPGHSGAPVIDAAGRVVAIGSGGLQRGAVGIGWAVRARYLADLAHAPEGVTVKVSARDLGTNFATVTPDAAKGGGGGSVKCGGVSLSRTRTLSLRDLAATSDDPRGLYQIAATTGEPFDAFSDLRFDIWVEPTSGGGVAVPSGATLKPGPDYCLATWANGELAFGVSGAALSAPPHSPAWGMQVQAASQVFEQRWASEFLPFLAQDPNFSYLMPREQRGGMLVNRKFFYGRKPDGSPPYGVSENLMAKGPAFIGIAALDRRYFTRNMLSPDRYRLRMAAGFAVHLSTFPP